MSGIFTEVRDALEVLERRLAGARDAGEREEILRRRADALAARGAAPPPREVLHHVFVVRRGDLLLGLPITSLVEVRRVEPVPLPHGDRVVQGLLQVRGRVYCLVDPLPLVTGEGEEGLPADVFAALVQCPAGPLALRVDETLGAEIVHREDCEEELGERACDFIVAVTRRLVAVADLERLAAHPEIRLRAAA